MFATSKKILNENITKSNAHKELVKLSYGYLLIFGWMTPTLRTQIRNSQINTRFFVHCYNK